MPSARESAYMRHVRADQPSGYWPMHETTGTAKNWGSVASADGTYTSATLGAYRNPFGGAAPRFTGSSSYMDVADDNAWTRAAAGWTIEALALTETFPGNEATIFSKGQVSNNTREWYFAFANTGGTWSTSSGFTMIFQNSNGSNQERYAVSPAYRAALRKWHHVAVVWDGTALWWVADGRVLTRSTLNSGAAYSNGTGLLRFGDYGTIVPLTGSVCHGAVFPKAVRFDRLLARSRMAA